MQAIIVTGGKQYKVAEGDTLFIEKLEAEAGHYTEAPRPAGTGQRGYLSGPPDRPHGPSGPAGGGISRPYYRFGGVTLC